MFGYVRPSVRDLPEEELDRFRAMYCGLCLLYTSDAADE